MLSDQETRIVVEASDGVHFFGTGYGKKAGEEDVLYISSGRRRELGGGNSRHDDVGRAAGCVTHLSPYDGAGRLACSTGVG